MIRRSLLVALLLAVVWLAMAVPALADDAQSAPLQWPTALAWLAPIGLGMLACGAVPPDRVAAVIRIGWLALAVSAIGYWLAGFAFQFGGVGFAYDHPELAGLAREWTWAPLDATWGPDWGAIGLEGYLLRGPASTPAALSLFLTQLPWVVTAVALPLWSLQGRTGPVVLFGSGVLQAALYSVIGNWVWGGGWLANLGLNLNLGHGYVDALGSGAVHLAGAASALAGMLAFGVRGYMRSPRFGDREDVAQLSLPGLEDAPYVPMPALHLPVLATFGAWLAAIGWMGWALSTPLHVLSASPISWAGTWINLWLAAGGGAIVALGFSWLTTGEGNALMVARGVLGALVAVGAGLPFMPPWAALAVGAGAGLLVPFVQYAIEHMLRFDDPTSAVATHGVPALWGLLAVGLFADGRAGAGWNRVGAEAYLGVEGQGITGYLAGAGFASDWPGQMQAQAVGIVAIGVTAFVLSWLLYAGVQGLSRAWVGEYTVRLPRRTGWRARSRSPFRGWRWPTIHIVRQASPSDGIEPSDEAPEAPVDGPPARNPPMSVFWSSLRRWAGGTLATATATARRLVERKPDVSAPEVDLEEPFEAETTPGAAPVAKEGVTDAPEESEGAEAGPEGAA